MCRAIRWLPIAALVALAFLTARPASSQNASAVSSGVALLDFRRAPDFKVGDWVRYHVWGTATGADRVEYVLTLLVAGEEVFWGDSCFWLEAWTEMPDRLPVGMATLVSYQAYRDSGAADRVSFYTRKSIMNFEEDGTPIEEIVMQARSVLTMRELPSVERPETTVALGRDTVAWARGVVECDKVAKRWVKSRTVPKGDSTVTNESRLERIQYHDRSVPITSLAREIGSQEEFARTWRSIRSSEGVPNVLLGRADNGMRLLDHGHGLTARFIPKERRASLADQAAARKAAKPSGSKASGAKSGGTNTQAKR
jgi:hypothetical protein